MASMQSEQAKPLKENNMESKPLTIEQIMAFSPKQKFYVATESKCESYHFVAMNPMVGRPLIIAVPNYSYDKAVVLDPTIKKRCEFYLEYYPALEAFIKFSKEKTAWWEERHQEHLQELSKKSKS